MILIWLLVVANYVVHVVTRETWWGARTVLAGHVVLLLQIFSFASAVHTHPGSPPADWEDKGDVAAVTFGPATEEAPAGVRVPPRAYYVKRMGATVLGFDHYCWWLGCAIGWRNRKFFVLFVLWSMLLAGFGCVVTGSDLGAMVPGVTMLGGNPRDLDPRLVHQLDQLRHANPLGNPMPALVLALAMSELSGPEMARAVVLSVILMADLVATILLGIFGVWHVHMILRNRTSIGPPGEEAYDVGTGDNWRQVMGRKWWLWPLPMYGSGDGPHGDGMSWPTRQTVSEAEA